MIVKVRHAVARDRAAIVAFNQAMALESEERALHLPTLEAGVGRVLDRTGEGFYLVAEADGRTVGSLLVTFEWSDWRNGRFWWIQSVYVLPAFRRRGVYSRLHAWVRDAARAESDACGIRLYVEKDNRGAQATYEALGMSVTDYLLYEEEFHRS